MDIVEQLAADGHGDKAEQLFSHLQKGLGYNQEVCNVILKLLNKGQDETAKRIMKTMPKTTNADNTIFKGAFFVKHLLKLNRSPESIIKTCQELQDEDLVPNAFFIATECALQQGQSELAQKLFKELRNNGIEIRQHYYWPLLVQKGKEGDEEGLLQILRTMASEGIPPTGEALRDYVIPYIISNGSPQNTILKLQIANIPTIVAARNVMLELLEIGQMKKAADIATQYHPWGQYNLVARPLLNALSKTKDIDSFATILHITSSMPQYQNEQDTDEGQREERMDGNEVGRIVRSAVKNLAKPDLCETLLTSIHSKGLRISTEAAEGIEEFLGEHMTTRLSELLAQLTSGDLELVPLESPKREMGQKTAAQLEQLIKQIKSKGGNANRLQKQLLLAYFKENDVNKVTSYVQELRTSNYDLTPATLAGLYEFYCQNDQIEKANEIKAELTAKSPDFVLNKFKLIQMAYALVRANRFDEVIKFLSENKPQDDGEANGFLYNSKCWQMLNHLAELKEHDKVRFKTS